MKKSASKRNKTIATSLSEGKAFLQRCLVLEQPADLAQCLDRTIWGDMLAVCSLLPADSVDLLIADPPYNLTKSFNGATFARRKAEVYADYTREWLAAVKPLLKADASIYVCCDWASSLIIGPVLSEFFQIRNRITWQREKGRGAKANWKNGLEDIWFVTNGQQYNFNLQAVKQRRRVKAPYRVQGRPKDWVETPAGNYRDTCPSNFGTILQSLLVNAGKYGAPHAETGKADCQNYSGQFPAWRAGSGPFFRFRHHQRGGQKAGAALYWH